MTRGSVLVVSYHFYPSPEVGAKRPSETALHLARSGYDVTVLRARDRISARTAIDADLGDLRLVSVTIPRRLFTAMWIKFKGLVNRNRPPASSSASPAAAGGVTGQAEKTTVPGWIRRQLLAYDTLFQGNKRWLAKSVLKLMLRFRRRRFDLVIASGPPMVSYICGYMTARILGAKLILDYRDPWYLHGDKELTTVMLGHPLARFENNLGRKCATNCDAIIAASPGTKRHILKSFDIEADKVRVIRNGFDQPAVLEEPVPRGRLELLYAGSLYWNRNPFPFLEALHRALRDGGLSRDKVRFRLVGNCETWKEHALAPWIAERNIQDVVEILPFMSPMELRNVLNDSNVLINFAQGQQRQIPAKSYDYIAARRDVLVITETDSDVADLFREAGIGTIVEPDDSAGLEDAIENLYAKHVSEPGGRRSTAIDVQPYSRATQLLHFTAVVEEVLQGPRSGAP